jgi:adenylate cyclase
MANEGFKRKLTAILSADAVGYSRLMRDDEEATVRDIASHRVLITEIVQQHHGRVIDSPGDNILAEFASVVDAVNGAIKIQEEIKKSNADTPKDRRMEFRIGINLGDVIEEEDRIYGDGVNIAARVEGLAAGGGIAISGIVYDSIKDKLKLGYQYLGEQDVKNIPEPVRVYRLLTEPADVGKMIGEKQPKPKKLKWTASGPIALIVLMIGGISIWNYYIHPSFEPASVEKMAFPLPDKPSIAVLPFENLTGDPDQEFFSDGMTEEIITALSKIPKLFVIARNSTFTYKGKPVKVQQVSEDLGVQYVIEGSVRRTKDRVRITAQLIDALKGHHIWAEKYDRNIEDIFAVQDEITKKIITALQVELTEGQQAGIYARGTTSLEAYLKIMEANSLYHQMSKESILKARALAKEAISLDPDYAFAYKTLGSTHGVGILLGLGKDPRESLKRTIEHMRKAIELDDSLAIAYGSLGFYLVWARQYGKSIDMGKRAFEMEPNSADVIIAYAAILTMVGEPEKAIPLFKEALRLNPKPPSSDIHLFAIALRDSGHYEEAIAQAIKAIKKEPDNLVANIIRTSSLSMAGRDEEARTAAKEILRINPTFSVKRYIQKVPQKDRAIAKHLGEALRKAGLPE